MGWLQIQHLASFPGLVFPDELHDLPVFAQILIEKHVGFVDDHLVAGRMQFRAQLDEVHGADFCFVAGTAPGGTGLLHRASAQIINVSEAQKIPIQ